VIDLFIALHQDPAGEDEGVWGAVDHGLADVADAEGSSDVVEGGRVVVEVHLGVVRGEDGIVGAALELEMALGLER